MLQKSGRLVLWEAMFILELHSAETQGFRICGNDSEPLRKIAATRIALDHFHLKITIPTIATAMPMAFRHSQGCFSTPNHPNSSIIYATAS